MRRARDGRRSRAHGRAMPTWPARSSTAMPISATCSSGRARGKRRRAWPRVPSPASCSPSCPSRSPATSSRSGRSAPRRGAPFDAIAALPDDSPTRCVDPGAAARMMAAIDAAREAGDTLGGVFEVAARGVPAGLGSYAQWDRRLDGRLAQALMSIPAIKAVSIGIGAEAAGLRGSQVHDEILPRRRRRRRGRTAAGAPANQPCRRPRGWRHQRPGAPRQRVDETDRHADVAAPVGRSRRLVSTPRRPSSAATCARCPPPRWSARP